MIAALISKNTMYKVTLPEMVRGNYSINDESGKKLINIESVNGNWQIVNSSNFKVIDPKKIKEIKNGKIVGNMEGIVNDNIVLKEYSVYYILFNNSDNIWILYSASTCEKYTHLNIKSTFEITIGYDKTNSISYEGTFIKNRHVRIFNNNGRLLLENFDTDFGCFINNKAVRK